tara:strand:- start:6139 stop:7026 length:888 start_codon:yes stop_codon:yes gene_type:complete
MTEKTLTADQPDDKSPLVSIGIPIFNEAKFLRASLESLLAQTYQNIEIIISDNASTDHTSQICSEYSNKYAKIKFHRFTENQGASANFDYVLEQSKGRYFMWAAGHDLWSDNHIAQCVQTLESHPTASLAFASTQWISETGDPHPNQTGWVDTRGLDPVARYFMVFWGNMNPILGLIRREYLATIEIKSTVGSDLLILTQLAALGDFVHADQALWSRREFRVETSYTDKLNRYKSSDYGLTTSFIDKHLPFARLPIELIKNVILSRLPTKIKTMILLMLIPALPVKYLSGRYLKG